ncbi:MAG: ABC transporter permease subunit [Candidatus Hodarchaeota archaeon]
MIRLSMIMKIVRKDWQDVKSNKQILMPMVILPVMFSLALPLLLVVLPLMTASLENVGAFLETNINTMIKPFFIMIPLMITMVTASDSWAGEKERKTAESLLLLPLTDTELLVAKVSASFIPGMVITWICGAAVTVMIDVAAFPVINALILPDFSWLFLLLVLAPIVAFFSIFLNVWVSYRSRDTKSASQIGGTVILLFVGFIAGSFFGASDALPYLYTVVFGVIDILMIKFSPMIFSRESIIAKI